MQVNSVIVSGRLGKDVELRTVGSGKNVCDLSIAVNDGYGDKETTSWISVTVWDKQAENCAKYLSKGSEVIVEGRLREERWEKDGQKRSKVRVVAFKVHFVSKADDCPKSDLEGMKEQAGITDEADDIGLPF